jgi:hypothetical protein
MHLAKGGAGLLFGSHMLPACVLLAPGDPGASPPEYVTAIMTARTTGNNVYSWNNFRHAARGVSRLGVDTAEAASLPHRGGSGYHHVAGDWCGRWSSEVALRRPDCEAGRPAATVRVCGAHVSDDPQDLPQL